jgi:hypothetical protein
MEQLITSEADPFQMREIMKQPVKATAKTTAVTALASMPYSPPFNILLPTERMSKTAAVI